MAFNPFTSFRKYQKFWMATVLLLCMITFVLCTGVGGDLSQRLLQLFQGPGGPPLAEVNGRKVYRRELDELKEQRNLANSFMKKASEIAVANVDARLYDQKMSVEQAQKLKPQLEFFKNELMKHLLGNRYFGTGVKLSDLVDFKVWLLEADRLGIDIMVEDVYKLLSMELFSNISGFSGEHLRKAISDLRQIQRPPTEALVINALRDEFRVRLAKNALLYDPYQNRVFAKEALLADVNPEARNPLTPAMLWDIYKKDRSAFDVSMVEVDVKDFINQVPEPTDADLKRLFAEGAKKTFDPALPTPGFEIPARVKVEYVIGDPTSPKFKQWSHAAILMETTPPAWIPSSPYALLTRYAGGQLAMRAILQSNYENVLRRPKFQRERVFEGAAWNERWVYQAMAFKLASAKPEAVASLAASLAMPGNIAAPLFAYAADGAAGHEKTLQAAVAGVLKERAPTYATLVMSGAGGSLWETMGWWGTFGILKYKDKALPLDIVISQITQFLEEKQAAQWVHHDMMTLRKLLDEPINQGRPANFVRTLKQNIVRLGLEIRGTKDYYDRFTIDKEVALKPFQKEFVEWYDDINSTEGRPPETAFKEGDFYRLFFDVGSTYVAKSWPPRVIPKKKPLFQAQPEKAVFNKDAEPIDYFEVAEKPILYWTTKVEPSKMPASLDEVRDRVVNAWKMEKARETKALPRAKEIATALQNSNVGFDPVLSIEATKLHAHGRPIVLKGLAPLYVDPDGEFGNPPPAKQNFVLVNGKRDYTSYTIPKNTFEYPRDDMAKELLSLGDLKKPIEIGDPELDRINKGLFEAGAKNGQMVQILTNKPHTAFYVACVTYSPGASLAEFQSALRYANRSQTIRGGAYEDLFVDRAHDQAGAAYQKALIEQLREQTKSNVLASPEEQKSFDASEA